VLNIMTGKRGTNSARHTKHKTSAVRAEFHRLCASPDVVCLYSDDRKFFLHGELFRYDDEGRLVEEWVRTDYRSFLRQLGAEGR
jgi:hypothetical protein